MATSAALVVRAVPPPPGAVSARAAAGADAGEEHVRDRAVHRVGHLLGEDRAGRADEHAGHDQRRVVERDAGGGRAQAREGVQGRDHDRHVGAADRHHGEHAERAREQQDQPEQQLGVVAGGDHDRQRDARSRAAPALTALGVLNPPFISSCSFRNAMFEPQNEIEPMIAANSSGISVSSGMSVSAAELDDRDQRHRAAADAVEQRDHLRHRGHLHAARGGDADRGADRDADDDQDPVADARAGAAWRRPRSPCRPPRPGCRAPPCAARAASAAPR